MSYIIAITGSVAVGKSRMSLLVKDMLSANPKHANVQIVSTDNFLFPADELNARGIMHQKGFPESYDQARLEQFIESIKAGHSPISIPVYSHLFYDITDEEQHISAPDILILEGVNAQTLIKHPLIDFSIFLDAPLELIKGWYLNRYNLLLDEARHLPDAYLHQLSQTPEEAVALACEIWQSVNERNYLENILPFKEQANLIMEKGEGHVIKEIRVGR